LPAQQLQWLLITPATSRATAAAAAATSTAIATPTTPAANGASQVFKPTGRLAVSENPLGPFAPFEAPFVCSSD